VHAFGREKLRMKKWQSLFIGLLKTITCEEQEQTLKKRKVENLNKSVNI
jgi:hypothetical protein